MNLQSGDTVIVETKQGVRYEGRLQSLGDAEGFVHLKGSNDNFIPMDNVAVIVRQAK